MSDKFDEGWENWADGVLEESPFDTDLGKELAKDAQAVTKGEMSEQEFHEKHKEDVEEEFGAEDRPTESSSFGE